MPDATATTPPRRKRRALKWFAGPILLLLLLFLYQLFGPNPAIIVSRETTYVIKPLGPDGLPDYRQTLLAMYREGVTPENNAAILLWPLIGRGKLDAVQYEAICKEIGVSPAPGDDAVMQRLESQTYHTNVEQWLLEQGYTEDAEELSYKLEEVPFNQPWKSTDFPPIAGWVTANEAALDLIIQASKCTHYYSPSPSLLGASDEPLFMNQFPGLNETKLLANCLIARAMWHLGEGRFGEAWIDILATHRLARLIGQGHSFIEQIVAVSISDLACDATVTLLHESHILPERLASIRKTLAALPDFDFAVSVLNKGERLALLDLLVKFSGKNAKQARHAATITDVDFVDRISIDWNVVLTKANDYHDDLAIAARTPETLSRRQAMARVDALREWSAHDVKRPARLLSALCTKKGRSNSIADFLLEVCGSSFSLAVDIEDRANLRLQLTRLSAELALYRSKYGKYPALLSDMSPVVADELTIDPYSNGPFIYRRGNGDQGYLLYSVFVNEQDDGGADVCGLIIDGEWTATKQPIEYFTNSDLVIRVPRPAFQLPNVAAPINEQP